MNEQIQTVITWLLLSGALGFLIFYTYQIIKKKKSGCSCVNYNCEIKRIIHSSSKKNRKK